MKGRKPKLLPIDGGGGSSAVGGGPGRSGRPPPPPSWLTQHAADEWRRAAAELYGRNLIAPDMLSTLASYCVAVGQVRELEEIMQVEGRTIPDPETGEPKRHAAFSMQMAAMREARLLAAELGLTPHRRGVKGTDGDAEKGWGADEGLLA